MSLTGRGLGHSAMTITVGRTWVHTAAGMPEQTLLALTAEGMLSPSRRQAAG
jgi:hypothetical protein